MTKNNSGPETYPCGTPNNTSKAMKELQINENERASQFG
jgi:hypothetical protein